MNVIKRARGRPKKLAAVDALLNAGRQLLLSHGLRVTVDMIVSEAHVAKTTFYTYFKDKEAFVEAVMLRESAKTITDEEFLSSYEGELRDTLLRFGIQYLTFANEVHLAAWDRLIGSANDLYPELAWRFYEAGPGRAYKLLTEILREADRKAVLNIPNPAAAAEELTALWYGNTVLQVNLRVLPPMTPEQIRSRTERGIDLLYRIYS